MSRYRRVITCLLLAWLPLQAAALPVLALNCHAGGADRDAVTVMDEQAMHAAMGAEHAHDPAAHAAHDSGAPSATDDGGPAGHQCCTHFTAVTATVFAAAKAPSAHAMATPPARAVSHLPDPPQQPPRATPL